MRCFALGLAKSIKNTRNNFKNEKQRTYDKITNILRLRGYTVSHVIPPLADKIAKGRRGKNEAKNTRGEK